jgi:hypothetical protein
MNILWVTAKLSKTLMATTPMRKQPKRLDSDPFGVLTIKIPARIRTPKSLLLVLINGLHSDLQYVIIH